MINKKNKLPIFNRLDQQTSTLSLGQFFTKALNIGKNKAEDAFTKLHKKLIDTPSVFLVSRDQREKLAPILHLSKEKSISVKDQIESKSVKIRAKSNLKDNDESKLRLLLTRKQQLMDRLRKIDYYLMNPSTVGGQLKQSRFSGEQSESRFGQDHHAYNQHGKTIEILERINNQKIRRQQKIVAEMRKKQQKQIEKLAQVQNIKSQAQFASRMKGANFVKINTKNMQQFSAGKASQFMDSQHATSQRQQNQFQGLPQLVTREEITQTENANRQKQQQIL